MVTYLVAMALILGAALVGIFSDCNFCGGMLTGGMDFVMD